ncbi:MAG: aminopeptidase [Thermodesulfovibrionia bacterium]|nr:MAG: aminopeptidase [Thermodesulfovibrionia bacterium]
MKKYTHLKTIADIYKVNLKIRKNEKVLVFTDGFDKNLKKIVKLISEKGKEYTKKTNYAEYKPTGSHGAEPPESLWETAFGKNIVSILKSKKLLKPLLTKKVNSEQLIATERIVKKFRKQAVNAVIALSYYSTTHTKFKSLLTETCGTRYASMPLFDKSMLKGAMRVNWENIAKRTKKIAKRINRSENIEIQTPAGTDFFLSRKGRKARADTGIITTPGSSGNLPAGEVYLAPLEGTANGSLVLEWSPTRKLKRPITLYVEKGMVKKIRGKEKYADYLKTKLLERAENANIAELGIGTNDKASRPDNILESEKILGTIHIALGDNSTFGGRVITPFHQDFVFFKPTVTLIHKNGRRELLLKDGKPH